MERRGKYVDLTWQADPALHAPPRYRRACHYRAFILKPVAGWQPSLDGDLAVTVVDAERRLQELNAKSPSALQPFARLLLKTESMASSKIEGMQTDVRGVARAEARQEAGASVGREAAEILANIDAMQLAVEEATSAERLDVETICRVHRALTGVSPLNETHAGRVRSEQNWIGGNDFNPCGADFVPPPPERVDGLLEDLMTFCGDSNLPPVVQAAIAHAQFETIHPFADGNGRAGRALIQVLLKRRGVTPNFVPPISVVLAAQRNRYISGLEAFREGSVAEWIEQFAVAATRSADLAVAYLEKVSELQDRWRQKLADSAAPRSDAAAWRVIDVLPAHPLSSIAVAVAATRRTRPAVAQAFGQLVEAGVLEELSGNRRNRVYEAVGLLDLLESMEAGVSVRT